MRRFHLTACAFALKIEPDSLWESFLRKKGTVQPVQIVKRLYLLFPLLLALLLLSGQLPELLSLIDDSSNDFVEECFVHVPECAKVVTVDAISRRSAVFEGRIAPIKPSSQLAPSSPPDLLRLLSIQRK